MSAAGGMFGLQAGPTARLRNKQLRRVDRWVLLESQSLFVYRGLTTAPRGVCARQHCQYVQPWKRPQLDLAVRP